MPRGTSAISRGAMPSHCSRATGTSESCARKRKSSLARSTGAGRHVALQDRRHLLEFFRQIEGAIAAGCVPLWAVLRAFDQVALLASRISPANVRSIFARVATAMRKPCWTA